MLNKEKSQIIRKNLKEQLGANSRQISVRTNGSSICVTINDLNFGLHMNKIKKIANEFKEIRYDEVTQETLCGGNTYVDVELNCDAIENAKKDFIEVATTIYNEALKEENKVNCTTVKKTDDYSIYFHLETKNLTLRYNNEIESKHYWAGDIDSIAEALTYIKYEHGVDVANEETEKIEEVKEVVETKAVTAEQQQEEEQTNNTNSIEVEINFNTDKDGIELKFNCKPDEEIRTQLKENGFRWSRYKKIWFAKDTEERRNFVNTLNNQQEENLKETNDFKIIIDGEGKREKAEFDNFKDAELEIILRSDIDYGYNKTWITIVKGNKELNKEKIDLNSKTDLTKGLKKLLIDKIDNDIKYCNVYIKDIEEMQRYIEECNKVKNILLDMDDYGNLSTKNIKETKQIEINSINEENFPISKELSKRENDGHWAFRTKERNHQQEILDTLNNYYSTAKEVINSTNNINIVNSINRYCNSFNKRYYNNYLKRLTNNANNPCIWTTGRGGRNINKFNKIQSKYDNLMRECCQLQDGFKDKVSSLKYKIRKEKQAGSKAKFEALKTNTDISNIKFKCIKTDNINGIKLDYTCTIYEYNRHYIISNYWGKFKIHDYKGMELASCNNLKDAKVTLITLLNNNIQQEVI